MTESVPKGDNCLHPIFRTDPALWMNYLHKEVCVTAVGGKTHTGRVYTVDPVSQSIVLMRCGDSDEVTVEVVMGHAVQTVDILDEATSQYEPIMHALFKPKTSLQEPLQLKAKRDKLKSWLQKNRLPVTECGVNGEQLSISDALTIDPPYEADSCNSTNEIILGKIQGLIKNMPEDVAEW